MERASPRASSPGRSEANGSAPDAAKRKSARPERKARPRWSEASNRNGAKRRRKERRGFRPAARPWPSGQLQFVGDFHRASAARLSRRRAADPLLYLVHELVTVPGARPCHELVVSENPATRAQRAADGEAAADQFGRRQGLGKVGRRRSHGRDFGAPGRKRKRARHVWDGGAPSGGRLRASMGEARSR